MSTSEDPVAAPLSLLARASLAEAPPPPSLAVIRILAERRRAEERSRRLLALLAAASLAPLAAVLVAGILQPVPVTLGAIALALSLLPALGGVANFVGRA